MMQHEPHGVFPSHHGREYLDSDWTLAFTHPRTGQRHEMTATVPGNVEVDLQREGLIDDPWPADSVTALRAFERVDDWTYSRRFDAPPRRAGETVCLVFEGIDTIADVHLNGERVLRCENMHIPHRLDVTGRLRPTANELEVRIFSPELHARRFPYPAGQVSRPHRQAEAYLRKARHMWGWDNAPRLLSAGLWRPVYLEILPAVRFTDVYAYTQRVTAEEVWIGCDWAIETPDTDLAGYRGLLRLSRGGAVEHEVAFDVEFTAGKVRHRLPRQAVQLWWPRVYGEPVLYDLSLHLLRQGGEVARWEGRFGVRELELVMSDVTNAAGEGEFVFVCNGERIYINGTNWKPLDALHSRAAGKVRRALELCLDLHCNMVRIWGGGVYEDHAFFDFCDEHGLLVWQDFMFACEFPPRDERFQQAVAVEAEAVVKRLRNHPSLALWCGDNEVDATFTWDTLIPRHLLPSHNEITRKVLRNAVLDHDPYRNYVPSSPYVSDAIARQRWLPADKRSDLATPESHLYPGDEHFREAFRRSAAHFIGETGPFFINAMSQSPDIVQRELPRARRLWDAPIDRRDYTLDRHQTDVYFLTWKDALRRRLVHLFGREFGLENWEELALATNILCGEIFKFAIEYSRASKWRKTGVLWWSLLDMWPMMMNYSVVDYHLQPKQPAYDWIRQSQQPLCLMVVERQAGRPELFVANDTLGDFAGSYRVTRVDAEGREQGLADGPFKVRGNSSLMLREMPSGAERGLWLIEWAARDRRGVNHYVSADTPIPCDAYRSWVDRVRTAYGRLPLQAEGNR